MLRIQPKEFINWQELDCSDQIFISFEAIGYLDSYLAESWVNGTRILHDVTARNSGVVNLSKISFEIPNNVSQGEAYFDNVKVYVGK